MSEKPTKEEVEKALKITNDIFLFVAMRGMWNAPVPEIIKLTTWLREEFKLDKDVNEEDTF